MIHRLLSQKILVAKDRLKIRFCFLDYKFSSLLCVQISCLKFCLKRTFQPSAQTKIYIIFRPNSLKFPASFLIYFLQFLKQNAQKEFVLICEGMWGSGNKLHAALYSFTVTFSSHIKWISVFILCTLYSSDNYACL